MGHPRGFWPKFVLPCLVVLAFGAFETASYNRAITGSALKPPYLLHEQQYQASPPFILTAVVPAGATTGPVVVTTPGGTLTSNVSFRIIK